MKATNVPNLDDNGTYENSLDAVFKRLLTCPSNGAFRDALELMKEKDPRLCLLLRNCSISAYLIGRVDSYAEHDNPGLDRYAEKFGWIGGGQI